MYETSDECANDWMHVSSEKLYSKILENKSRNIGSEKQLTIHIQAYSIQRHINQFFYT